MALLNQVPSSTVLLYGVTIAFALIYVPFLAVAYGRLQVGYDPAAPRTLFDKLPPYAQRATWAHQNALESFPAFAAAAIMAYVTGVESPVAAGAAIAYGVARSLYPLFYILNLPVLRSLMFGVGSVSIITLFVLSLLQVSS